MSDISPSKFILTCITICFIVGCHPITSGPKENIEPLGKESLYKSALYSQFDITNLYSDSILLVKKNFEVLDEKNQKIQLYSLVSDSLTLVFRFNEITSCSSCVDDEFIELKAIAEKEKIKFIIIVDSTSLKQKSLINSRFSKEIYSLEDSKDILPFGHNIPNPYVILFSNRKADKFFILGIESKRYAKIFNNFLRETIRN